MASVQSLGTLSDRCAKMNDSFLIVSLSFQESEDRAWKSSVVSFLTLSDDQKVVAVVFAMVVAV